MKYIKCLFRLRISIAMKSHDIIILFRESNNEKKLEDQLKKENTKLNIIKYVWGNYFMYFNLYK